MGENLKYYVILHITILIWGFTGILGDLISISADKIAFYRMLISFISLFLIGFFVRKNKTITRREIIILLFTGGAVGLHWYCFFLSIKLSTVSIAVVCLSASTLFISLIEPLIFKRKFMFSELFISFAIIAGIITIFGFESEYYLGIITGLLAAFFAALFTVINGNLIHGISSFRITKYEMLGGTLTLFIILLVSGKVNSSILEVQPMDWLYLLLLGLVCTTAAFMVSVWVMKFISPFTVSLSITMEPIYTIILVLLIDYYRGTNQEKMSAGFYVGTLLIIGSIFVNAYLKKRARKKLILKNH
ncbi:MAG: DMT family transporter [Crocinitomicaceae bacterium]